MERAARGDAGARRRRQAPRDGPPGVGEEVDGYRLEARLGEGGQGIVFRARRDGRLHALKFLPLLKGDWAWRELEVRERARHLECAKAPCPVRLSIELLPLRSWKSKLQEKASVELQVLNVNIE